MPKPFRLILLIADGTLSGGPRHVLLLIEQLKQLAAATISIDLICPPGWLADTASQFATVHRLPMGSGLDKATHARVADTIKQILAAEPIIPTVLHVHGVRAGIYLNGVVPMLDNKNLVVVYTEHRYTHDFKLPNPLRQALQLRSLRRALTQVHKVIAVSDAVARFLTDKHMADRDKITVIHHGVPLPPDTQTHTVTKNTSNYRLGSVGSLIPIKRFELQLLALPLIRQNFPGTTLEIVGDGPLRSHLERLAKHLRIEKSVTFAGTDPHASERMKNWDIFLSTSTTETFGLAIAEAMAVKLPVVAMATASTQELVTPETGIIVAPGNVHDVAKAVIDLLPQTTRRQQLGTNARQRVETLFTPERMAKATARVYEQALQMRMLQ